eukprot:TRINITY_DN1423_c0_g1_i1.p1 TRINITY_DN1423_c0_g1~~TRINITY_DN1423_c0_g1_i1.p1  ORF type:complete len:286 (+),score=51.48 TRINITY_DN1423_c0_g1_i1:26-883(+)
MINVRLCVLVLCWLTLVNSNILIGMTNCSLSLISGHISLVQSAAESCTPASVSADFANQNYISYYLEDGMKWLQVVNINTGKEVSSTLIQSPLDMIFYDAKMKQIIAFTFEGLTLVDPKSGALSPYIVFPSPLPFIEEGSMAVDTKSSRFFFMNGSSGEDYVTTIDYQKKQISLSTQPIHPVPGQQISPMWFSGDKLIGFADKSLLLINPISGELTKSMDLPYTPFDTSSDVDTVNHRLTFVGTNGKEQCFIVTVDLTKWTVIKAVQTEQCDDFYRLSNALVYFP